MRSRWLLRVTGTVQGVGFRPFVYREAVALGLDGTVTNDPAGVLVDVEGPLERLVELRRRIESSPPPLARVEGVEVDEAAPAGASGFRIVESRHAGLPSVAVSVDVATCDACLADVADPTDRRHRYPFTTCTDCGPRYTVTRSVPYDRATTTMAEFAMCDACRREYEDPNDRRYHAETIACVACGPTLRLVAADASETALGDDALDAAAALLVDGAIVAVKGLGGFHIAVDATDDRAVRTLRRRKARDDKPFALMVPDLATAEALCTLDAEAVAALVSPRRPIVVAPRRGGSGADAAPAVADAVAPGLAELGIMLPYTPLHAVLLAAVARPLVMTSGNLSDEPIAYEDDDAVARLAPLVDATLTSDRPIHVRCDDSIVRATPAGVQMVRRSRGFAPEPLALPRPAPRPVLAVGAELKNTVAIARGGGVVASHHIGDLEHLPAYASFRHAIDHLCRLTGTVPEVVAHDLHPEYLSTKYALELDLPTLGVQHHHAHVASCLVDHGVAGPVLGIAFDGLGYGCDAQLWGGELLVADLTGFSRVGWLRPTPLPGGSRAIREPWRMATSWLLTALGPDAAERYAASAPGPGRAVLDLTLRPSTPSTTSAGRLFDAVAALVGLRTHITYEGQAAIELEACAAHGAGPPYDVEVVDDGSVLVLDPTPTIAAVAADVDAGVDRRDVAARFHAGLADAVAGAAATAAQRHDVDTAVLTGGVFQNALLSRLVGEGLEARGLRVLRHRRVPPNDGGISIGQAAVAAASID